MDRETAICILLALLIAVAVTIWSATSGDWQRAEAEMFDGLSPEARCSAGFQPAPPIPGPLDRPLPLAV